MPDPADAAKDENVSYLVFDLYRFTRKEYERRVAEAGLIVTPAEARLLSILVHYGGSNQNELASVLGLSGMSLSTALDRLERANLVRRTEDSNDRRAKRVDVTEDAGPVLDQLKIISAEVREAARGDISPEDWAAFRRTALRARDNLKAAQIGTRTAAE